MYRSLHGAPILAGVPLQYLLGLLGAGVVGGVGAMFASRLAGLVGLGAVVAAWGGLGVLFGRDRVVVPTFVLRLRYRIPARIASYAPSYLGLRVVEDEAESGS
jgi:hypothetical protein